MDKGETTGHMPSVHGICQRILAPGNGFLRMLRSVEFPCVDGYRAAGGWSINRAGAFCLVACFWVLTTADREETAYAREGAVEVAAPVKRTW